MDALIYTQMQLWWLCLAHCKRAWQKGRYLFKLFFFKQLTHCWQIHSLSSTLLCRNVQSLFISGFRPRISNLTTEYLKNVWQQLVHMCWGPQDTNLWNCMTIELSLFLNFLLLKPSFHVSFNLLFLFREICNSSHKRGESSNAEPCTLSCQQAGRKHQAVMDTTQMKYILVKEDR